MRLNCNSFFDGDFDYINLNDFYLANKTLITDTKIPSQIQDVLNSLNKNTYGGWAEDRKDIWAGTYMDEKKNYIHLGIDINVKEGTEVRCPFDTDLVDVFTDTDTQIGWGGRMIFTEKYSNITPFLVLAHLDPNSLVTDKQRFNKGDVIGRVGTWPTNGNTFQHLHVQVVRKLDFSNFDGYGYVRDLANNPNPFQVDFL